MIDASALGAWELLADRLGRYIRRRVPGDDAEDVRQDVLLRIFKGASSLDDEARFGPWVYAVARNAVIDRLRAKRLPTTAVDEIDLPAEEIEDDARPLLDCVAPFVAQLPSPYREAITLTDLRGLTQQEAAEVVGVTLSGMKSRVQRGRRMLREMFEACCHLTVDRRGRVIDARRRGAADESSPQSPESCEGKCR